MDKSATLILVALMVIQGIISIFIMYGLNKEYVEKHGNMWRAMWKLYEDKPTSAVIALACWYGMYVWLLIVFVANKAAK